jgi:hypothetical protein
MLGGQCAIGVPVVVMRLSFATHLGGFERNGRLKESFIGYTISSRKKDQSTEIYRMRPHEVQA